MRIQLTLTALALLLTTNAFTLPDSSPRMKNLARFMSEDVEELGLTPELRKVSDAFRSINDEQLRYKQLLYMAQNTKEANEMAESSKTSENKVQGCLSTVYIDGSAKHDNDTGEYLIDFIGDSDGLLTRGLVALLVRCLSGNTASAIQKVDPQFIQYAQIEQSLTPGRNNGFLNMLAKMKQKALLLEDAAKSSGGGSAIANETPGDDEEPATAMPDTEGKGPKYQEIVAALQALNPSQLQLTDNSHQHAGHAGNDMDGESHFELQIVAEAFDGLSLVQRHQLIYMMLGEVMPRIHALQIASLTPSEVKEKAAQN